MTIAFTLRPGVISSAYPGPTVLPLSTRVLHAGPTTGKSYFEDHAPSTVTIVDTDMLFNQMYPKEWAERIWRNGGITEPMERSIGEVCAGVLDADENSVIVTNLWSLAFRQGLGRELVGGKIGISLFRRPAAINQLSKERGGAEIPLETAERWFRDWERDAHNAFHLPIILAEGKFLSDAVKLTRR